jgi:hypothetical protein
MCGGAVGACKLLESPTERHFAARNPIITFYQAQSGGPRKTATSAVGRSRRSLARSGEPDTQVIMESTEVG